MLRQAGPVPLPQSLVCCAARKQQGAGDGVFRMAKRLVDRALDFGAEIVGIGAGWLDNDEETDRHAGRLAVGEDRGVRAIFTWLARDDVEPALPETVRHPTPRAKPRAAPRGRGFWNVPCCFALLQSGLCSCILSLGRCRAVVPARGATYLWRLRSRSRRLSARGVSGGWPRAPFRARPRLSRCSPARGLRQRIVSTQCTSSSLLPARC